jgi:hyperosmotically inducible periplasmic protein
MDMNRIARNATGRALFVLAAGFAIGMAHAASPDTTEPKAHSDSVGAAVSDTAITAKVKSKMLGDKNIGKSDINVTTTNGVVTLAGSAVSMDAKSAATTVAQSVEGVKTVDNNLTTPTGSVAAAKTQSTVAKSERVASDSWITTKVKSELLADSLTKGSEVHVKTTHGVVVLKGNLVNQDAIDHAKDIAAKIEGVKSVNVTNLKVASK